MAYDEKLADRIRAALAGRTDVREKRMFGGLAFMVEDEMTAVAGEGGLMVRCQPDRTEELVAREGAERPVMGTRTMSRGWITLAAGAALSDEEFAFWMAEALGSSRKG